MGVETITLDFSKPLRLFPLQSCVLLPHAAVPLHVFEPRYRAMLRDALDSDGLIAMATSEGDGWKQDYAGNPPLRPCVTVGYLARDHRLDDGRHNILLHGVCRARLTEEQPNHPDGYRLALAEPYGAEIDPDVRDELDAVRNRLEVMLDDPKLRKLSVIKSIRKWLHDEVPSEVFVELGVLGVTQDTDERYAVLSEPDPLRRAALFEGYLSSMRDLVDRAERGSSGRDADGWALN
ncbi:MAG: LON peptidase substrate-binding domain-containing protein [Planctomycetota bacterium]